MRIEVCGGGLAGVVGDLHHDDVKDAENFGVLRLYLDSHCLISARSRPLQSMKKLRQEVDAGLKVPRPVVILTHFLHHVTDTLSDLLIELTNDVDDLEEDLLAGKLDCQVPELGRIRRIAVRLRRHMVPQAHALTSLLTRLPPWVGEDGARDLRAAIERLTALGHDLDLVQDRARLVGDQLSGRLMEATNRNLLRALDRHHDLPADDADHRHLRHEPRRPAVAAAPLGILVRHWNHGRARRGHVVDAAPLALVLGGLRSRLGAYDLDRDVRQAGDRLQLVLVGLRDPVGRRRRSRGSPPSGQGPTRSDMQVGKRITLGLDRSADRLRRPVAGHHVEQRRRGVFLRGSRTRAR